MKHSIILAICVLCAFTRCFSAEPITIPKENVTCTYARETISDGSRHIIGTIHFRIPSFGCEFVTITKSRPHRTENNIIWYNRAELHFDNSEFTEHQDEQFCWGTLFCFKFFDENRNFLYTDTICTNDFIDQDDLNWLFGTSGLNASEIGVPDDYRIDGGTLHMLHPGEALLRNSSGLIVRRISGSSSDTKEIPIGHLPKGIYFLTITDKDYLKTYKIII